MKHHSSQRNVDLPTPLIRKFVTPKASDYSNKLRLGLGRCHLEQRAYCLNINWQIQVGTMGYFLIRKKTEETPSNLTCSLHTPFVSLCFAFIIIIIIYLIYFFFISCFYTLFLR